MVGEVTERLAVTRGTSLPGDFRLRVVSGLVLAVVALVANYAGPSAFGVLVIVIASLMCWEWGSVVRNTTLDAKLAVHASAIVGAALFAASGIYAGALVTLLVGTLGVAAIRDGIAPRLSVVGVLYVGVPAVALIWLRNNEPYGALAILFIFTVVWTTDTFAYICGTLIGGPKLWPRVSPNKTWAGTVGGVTFAALAGLALALLISRPSPLELAAGALALSVCAQAGDLAESALKRAFDVKHASQLIPGHGGFLDRMDGIVAAASVAAGAAVLVNAEQPARALLYWN